MELVMTKLLTFFFFVHFSFINIAKANVVDFPTKNTPVQTITWVITNDANLNNSHLKIVQAALAIVMHTYKNKYDFVYKVATKGDQNIDLILKLSTENLSKEFVNDLDQSEHQINSTDAYTYFTDFSFGRVSITTLLFDKIVYMKKNNMWQIFANLLVTLGHEIYGNAIAWQDKYNNITVSMLPAQAQQIQNEINAHRTSVRFIQDLLSLNILKSNVAIDLKKLLILEQYRLKSWEQAFISKQSKKSNVIKLSDCAKVLK